ncbi:MAG: FAD-dependent oxidoreductase [Oscillospiraceae bacterium]|nr:FAD-dependent oxidoreductase [Oscillospiraceae bacterium]
MKIAVLGAGISGLSAARLLKDKGCDVTVYEKNDTIGGLARSRTTGGILYDPHGGHILNSKHPEVMEWAFSICSKDNWQYTERNAKIYFSGKYISYPFELSLCELDMEDAVNCVHDFILSQQGERPDNYKDWLIWNFGKAISDYYMIPYNEKIWAYPLDKMETHWMEGKMPLPSKKDMIRSMLLKDPTERKMPHSTFYYPLNGGIQTFVNAVAEGLNIICGSEIQSIEHTGGKWYVNGDGEYDTVISTIPLPCLRRVMELPDGVAECIGDLKYNSLTTVLFECPETDITWLYIPSHDYRSHRVGYQSTLTPNAINKPDRGCAALEIIGSRFNVTGLENERNILPEELGYRETLDSEFTEFAYVIHDLNYRKNITHIRDYFSELKGFELLGRWGRWNYNNMDLCIWDSMNLVKEILSK